MNSDNMNLPWDLVQSFKAVAEQGSLSGAARALGMTQPTVGRHIDTLEDKLKVSLFVRGREGMKLTERGQDLVSSAAEMDASAQAFSRKAAGYDEEISGTVRLTATDVFGVMIMPHLISAFRAVNNDIEVELVVTNQLTNLLRRDADVAIRFTRPTQNDLIARKITELPMGLFAHADYIKQHGSPSHFSALVDHQFIGFDRDPILIDAAKNLGVNLSVHDFCFRSDSILAQIEALRAGVGIAVTHVGIADKSKDLVRVLPDLVLPSIELWVTCHSDVRYNKRIRLIMDFLAENLISPYEWCQI